MSDIVLNALGEDHPGEETPLEKKLAELQASLERSRARLARHDESLERIRQEVLGYTEFIEAVKRRSDEADQVARTLPAEVPETLPVFLAPAPVKPPLPVAAPVPLAALPAARQIPPGRLPGAPVWKLAMPYAGAAAFALVFILRVMPEAAPRASLAMRPVPPPELAAAPEPAPEPAPQPELTSNEEAQILDLILTYVPPGSRRSIEDLLAPELEAVEGSPWMFARVDKRTTLVSFRGAADDSEPVYEFVVDLDARTVSPSPETLQGLGTSSVARR